MLEGKAQVVGPSDNCQYSLFTLSSMPRWIGALGSPDIVRWNNGIHDAGHNPGRSPMQIPIDAYRENLGFILKRLMSHTEKIIWATTTPVHPDRTFKDTEWAWRNEEIDQYNKVALDLMKSEGIPVNDLHALVRDNADQLLSDDMLHLSKAGQEACAKAAVTAITPLLG
jgi:lysophospholipase L1-like esterase